MLDTGLSRYRQPRYLQFLGAMLAVILCLIVAVSFYLFAQEKQSYEQLSLNILEIGEQGLQSYLGKLQSSFNKISNDLALKNDKIDYKRAFSALKFYSEIHPELRNITLIRADGQILLTALTPYSPTLPSLASNTSFVEYIRTGQQNNFDVGRPLISLLRNEWIIPIRLAIRDNSGRLIHILSANLPVSFLDNFWKSAPITKNGAIGLIRDDGYAVGRYPIQTNAELKDVFGTPRTGSLMTYLRANNFPQEGVLEGPINFEDDEQFIVFKRIEAYSLTQTIYIPKFVIYASWLRKILGFYLVMGILLAVSLIIYVYFRRSQRLAEEALRDSEGIFNKFMSNSPVHVYIKDDKLRLLKVSKSFETLLGKPISELLGKDSYDLLPPEFAKSAISDDLKTLNDGLLVKSEETLNGRVYSTIKFPIHRESGKSDYLGGFSIDITELKQAESDKEKLEVQLMQSQKMEVVGQLAGGIAHEFNNILAVIVSVGYLLNLKLKEDGTAMQDVSEIMQAADRAAVLTKSLLAFSRKQRINPKPMDLNASIRDTEKILGRTIGEDIHLSLQLTEANTTVHADSNQISQILINLAANARDAMPQGGELTISTENIFLDEAFVKMHGYGRFGEYVLMTVTDTGVGMDAATRQNIFEPFFTTKQVGKGTGLGLSTVYGIVTQHEGFIDVYSELNKGTVFKIYLPALETKVEVHERNGHFEPEAVMETILLVEDDSNLRKAMTKMLQEFGHTVIEAYDGDDAVTKFLEHKNEIHLVLMDVIMPRKSGADAFHEIKAIKPDIEIILMSGYAGDFLSGKLRMEDDIHFITKPISPKELYAKIRSVLNG